MTRFVRWWTRCYTAGLPAEVRDRRRLEIVCDLHEHAVDGGTGLAILGRTLRGMPADVFWRIGERRAMGRPSAIGSAWAAATHAWFAPAAVLVALFDVGVSAWVVTDADGKMPGRVVGPALMSALAAALAVGLWLRWRSTSAASPGAAEQRVPLARLSLVLLAVVGVVGIVGLGMASLVVLLAGVLALAGMAAAGRSGTDRLMLADVLIVAGTLPALAIWWMVFPAVLALVVIAGVVGTGPGTRRRLAS